jgi:ABC-type glutathione transport system ATPase component
MGVRRCNPARLADHRPPGQVTVLFISHDLSAVRHLADRTVVLYRGQVMEAGPAEDVADAPLHPDTIALTAVSPVIDVDSSWKRARCLRRGRSHRSAPVTPQASALGGRDAGTALTDISVPAASTTRAGPVPSAGPAAAWP